LSGFAELKREVEQSEITESIDELRQFAPQQTTITRSANQLKRRPQFTKLLFNQTAVVGLIEQSEEWVHVTSAIAEKL
jgi:hypothetical protein